jgi:hypothetical protein
MAVVNERLAYEARLRPRQAIIAGIAGLLLLGAAVIQSTGAQAKVSELTVQLIVTNKRAGLEILGAIVNALGLIGLAATLAFLFGGAKARRPQMSQASWWTVIAGGVLAAAGGIAYGIVITAKAHDFVTHGQQTYQQANSLLSSGPIAALQYGGLLGSLLLAIAFVMISLNAMRVGLLTKFLGYLGVISAGASLLLVGSAPALVLEIFWLLAVAWLLAGRLPSGDPPAWKTGNAEPWPTGAELRAQRQQAMAERRGRADGRRKPARQPEPTTITAPAPPTRATTSKRKRKRRK